MRIGVLTGGGDCPGLNAVIRAVIRKGEGVYGHSLIGYKNGWKGVVEGTSTKCQLPAREDC
jgi:6-phosphofructokinase 1